MPSPYRRREGRIDTDTQGRSHMVAEAEVGVTLSQAKGRQEPREARRGRKGSPLEPAAGAQPCPHCDPYLWPLEL